MLGFVQGFCSCQHNHEWINYNSALWQFQVLLWWPCFLPWLFFLTEKKKKKNSILAGRKVLCLLSLPRPCFWVLAELWTWFYFSSSPNMHTYALSVKALYFCWGTGAPHQELHFPLRGSWRSHQQPHQASCTGLYLNTTPFLTVGLYEPSQLSFGAEFWSDALFCTNFFFLLLN